MGRIKVNSYLDVVVTHPELSEDELEKLNQEEKEKSGQLVEWPKM